MPALSSLFQVHIATFFFGLAGIFVLSTGLDPVLITFGRTLFASIALVLFWRILAQKNTLLLSTGVNVSVLFTGLLLCVHWICFFTSIKVSTVAVGLIMFSTCQIFIALLEPLVFREPFALRSVIPAIIVVLGIVIMTGVFAGEMRFGAGVLWGLASASTFAFLQLLNRKLTATHSAASLALVQNAVACCMLLPFVFGNLPEIAAGQWLQLIFLGIVCTALAQTLFINSMRELNAAVASLIAAGLEPVYGVVLAAALYSQFPDVNVLVGGALVLVTVLYVSVKVSKLSV